MNISFDLEVLKRLSAAVEEKVVNPITEEKNRPWFPLSPSEARFATQQTIQQLVQVIPTPPSSGGPRSTDLQFSPLVHVDPHYPKLALPYDRTATHVPPLFDIISSAQLTSADAKRVQGLLWKDMDPTQVQWRQFIWQHPPGVERGWHQFSPGDESDPYLRAATSWLGPSRIDADQTEEAYDPREPDVQPSSGQADYDPEGPPILGGDDVKPTVAAPVAWFKEWVQDVTYITLLENNHRLKSALGVARGHSCPRKGRTWSLLRNVVDPYLAVQTFTEHILNLTVEKKSIFASRAYLKLLDLDAATNGALLGPLVEEATRHHQTPVVLDLASSPGSWSQLLQEVLDFRLRIISISLQSPTAVPAFHIASAWRYDYQGTVQSNNDITNPKVLREFIERVRSLETDGQLPGLVVGDGGIDVQGRERDQETCTFRLWLCEAIIGLCTLRRTKTRLVIKSFGSLGIYAILIRLALASVFTTYQRHKPLQSRGANSEEYDIFLELQVPADGSHVMDSSLARFLVFLNDQLEAAPHEQKVEETLRQWCLPRFQTPRNVSRDFISWMLQCNQQRLQAQNDHLLQLLYFLLLQLSSRDKSRMFTKERPKRPRSRALRSEASSDIVCVSKDQVKQYVMHVQYEGTHRIWKTVLLPRIAQICALLWNYFRLLYPSEDWSVPFRLPCNYIGLRHVLRDARRAKAEESRPCLNLYARQLDDLGKAYRYPHQVWIDSETSASIRTYQVPKGSELATILVRAIATPPHQTTSASVISDVWCPKREICLYRWRECRKTTTLLGTVPSTTQRLWWSLPCPFLATVAYYHDSQVIIPLEIETKTSQAFPWRNSRINPQVQSPLTPDRTVICDVHHVEGQDFWQQRWTSVYFELNNP